MSRTAIADVGSGLSLGVVDNELLLIDEAGRRTGPDPATGKDLFEIPESGYSRDSIIDDVTGEPPTEIGHFLVIDRPAAGTYRLVVTGEKVGPYEVSIRAWSDDGSPKPALSIQGFATVGSTDTYRLSFNPAPGQPVVVANPPGISELNMSVGSRVELLIVDPAGRRTGFVAGSEEDVMEIPESSYSRDALDDDITGEPATRTSHFLTIVQPTGGNYQLFVTGIKAGPYRIRIRGWSADAIAKPRVSIEGFATVGSTDTYELSFDPAPGQPVIVATRVTIDIKPGSHPNSINLGSGGTVPVAIFSTASFDATKVDPLTVTLASAPVKMKGKGTPQASSEDVNGDGRLDLVVHVKTEALQLSPTDQQATLEGRTLDGKLIRGSDSVRVVP